MFNKRVLTLFISFIICFSALPFVAVAANNTEKGERQVYLHAFPQAPALSSSENRRTVNVGEVTDIYLAVDNPNKGDTQGNTHLEPQFDMQGYTVKIYFDTKYFEFADDENPIDYKVPNKENGFGFVDSEDVEQNESVSVMPGYMTHLPASSDSTASRDGYARATVFLMSNGYFPSKTAANENLWYNLCKIPLRAKETGPTSVRIEYETGTKDDLELFAKNVADEKLNFSADVLNGGIFYLNITEAGRPSAPIATMPGGTYHDEVNTRLYHENADACEIYYSTDGATDPRDNSGTNPKIFPYTEGQTLTYSVNTTIKAAVYRPYDGKWSDVVNITYEFLPRVPYLFNSTFVQIPNIYSETWNGQNAGYYVYACDNKDFSLGITAGNTVYYTFNENLSADSIPTGGTNPDTEWVGITTSPTNEGMKLQKQITKSETVLLVTKNKWGISDVVVYHLSIRPAPVSASPDSGLDVQQPVTLSCDTQGAVIYYTTNGDDPRKETKTVYTSPLYLEEDTVIKAVSYYEGEWSEVTSFWYVFSNKNKSGVSAVYPSGVYTGSVEVILYPDTPGEIIEVSFDGTNWTEYDGTIIGDTTTVDAHVEFNARIKRPENTPDDHGDKFVYIIKPLAPVFSPESCEFSGEDAVTVFSPESTNANKERFELWYTTDGTDPTADDKAQEDTVIVPVKGYTKIKAVVVKDGQYKSDVITHEYNVRFDAPAKPIATLPSGYYTREIGSDEFTVSFLAPPHNVEIYYTIGKKTVPFDAPDGVTVGTKYDGTPIPVKNGDMIQAISVQTVGGRLVKSSVAKYWYEITPQAPKAPASGVLESLPLIPVDALSVESASGERSKVFYKIGTDADFVEGNFCTDADDGNNQMRFYIDTKTGNAYLDAEKQTLLYDGGRSSTFSGNVILEIKTTLDGAESETNAYAYILGDSDTPLSAPYADKESGTYTESKDPFVVHFYSIYEDRDDIQIQWKYDGDPDWTEYDPTRPLSFETKDKIVYVRTVSDGGEISPSVGYIYTFNPPVPEITPPSGIYLKSDGAKAYITQSSLLSPQTIGDYEVYYRLGTDRTWASVRGANDIFPYTIEETMTVMAYTYNIKTRRVSDTVHRTYIVAPENALGTSVTILWPYSRNRIGAHELGKGEYLKGVQFTPESNVYYTYSYTLAAEEGGGGYTSDPILFDPKTAFVPTARMDNVSVTVWIGGDKLNTAYTHDIDIVHLGIPETDLPVKTEYEKNTPYHLVNVYTTDPNKFVYYTTDGTDPKAGTNVFRLSEKGPEEKLTQTTTVRAVYLSVCGTCTACTAEDFANCENKVFGEEGKYTYAVTKTVTVGGGGGGGGTIDKTRKYTKDMFGNAHPTHIGYINGYPDGTVRPEGDITREEITAILYRITNHAYEKPFVATGDAFPDVAAGRWSAHDIEYMADKGLVLGYPDGEFKPAKHLTRAEFATLISRFIEAKPEFGQNYYTDLGDTHWAHANILSLSEAGLMQGYDDDTFRPEKNITRAEVMTVVNKILGRKPLESYVKSLHFNPFSDLSDEKWYYVDVLEATITHNYWLDNGGYEYKWEDWK